MNEIKIYHSSLLAQIAAVVLSLFIAFIFLIGCFFVSGNTVWGFLFMSLIASLCALAAFYSLYKERILGKNYITITDDKMIINQGRKHIEIPFDEVEHFDLYDKKKEDRQLLIHFKAGIKPRSALCVSAWDSSQAVLKLDSISISRKKLLGLLNERMSI